MSDNVDADRRTPSSPGSGCSDAVSVLTPTIDSGGLSSTSVNEADLEEWVEKGIRDHNHAASFASSATPNALLASDSAVLNTIALADDAAKSTAPALAESDDTELGLTDLPPISADSIVNSSIAMHIVGPHEDSLALTDTDIPAPGQELPVWPLQDEIEANLFRYFIESVARTFDLCDPERHFAMVVPCRAMLYSPLLNAMVALSAKYLSQSCGYDQSISHRYYQRSLRTLRPMLCDEGALMDENLFAATVILRNCEEVDGMSSFSPLPDLCYLRGSGVLTDRYLNSSALRRRC